MARQSGEISSHTTKRKSSRMRDSDTSQSLIQLNNDALEKESRRNSNVTDAKRQSIASVARETIRNSNNVINANTTKEKEAPILANFEQWMKLVKDNKINATNSWNFALIDYFHDMSLLKEGDGINFQRASYTLDGCVKIYTSRVDSVASETGKLLSGLADSDKKKKKKKGNGNGDGDDDDAELADDDEADSEDDEGDGNGQHKQKKKKRTPKAESTLAKTEEQLQAKKLDLELSIDPLFRKMCADFDEGGAKGLLLNSLVTDKNGRVVFDGEVDDDAGDDDAEGDGEEDGDGEIENNKGPSIDMAYIKSQFVPDLGSLDNLEVCPSLKHLNSALTDPALFSSSIMKEIEDNKSTNENGNQVDENDGENNFMMDADDLDDGINFDPGNDDEDMGFGGVDITPSDMPMDDNNNEGESSAQYGGDTTAVGGGMPHHSTSMIPSKDLMSYFDETLKKNWAGPQHWKIQKLKATNSLLAPDTTITGATITTLPDGTTTTKKKQAAKNKEPFYIDFLSEEQEVDESVIFAEGGATINIPKSQWKSKNKNLLPDDKHFTSQNLVKLFLKPKGTIKNFKVFGQQQMQSSNAQLDDVNADEHFWANQYQQAENNTENDNGVEGNYDANFFHEDDGADGMPLPNFDDYPDDDYDDVPNGPTSDIPSTSGDLKDQLLLASRRARPEYVNYAKAAKKINIRLLKDNIWNVLKIEEEKEQSAQDKEEEQNNSIPQEQELEQKQEKHSSHEDTRRFTDIVNDLKTVYPPQQMSEISTSFCFICVLHLANEKGLSLEGTPNFNDLYIQKDHNAIIDSDE